MSLKPLVTHFDAADSLYAPYTGGGGGGGGGGATVTTSTLTVSTIQSANTDIQIFDPLNFAPGANMTLQPGGAGGDIIFSGSQGAIVGVSSINSQPYPPPGAAAPISTTITGGVMVGSAPVNLVPAGPTLSTGKCYMLSANLDATTNGVVGAPTQGDHAAIILPDTSIPLTIDLAQLSSFKGRGQPIGYSLSCPFVAGAGAFQLSAYCNNAATASTFLGGTGLAWLTPLN